MSETKKHGSTMTMSMHLHLGLDSTQSSYSPALSSELLSPAGFSFKALPPSNPIINTSVGEYDPNGTLAGSPAPSQLSMPYIYQGEPGPPSAYTSDDSEAAGLNTAAARYQASVPSMLSGNLINRKAFLSHRAV